MAQVSKLRPTIPFIGDAGTGGKPGAVPAPAAGDAVRPKFLAADGSWQEVGRANQGVNLAVSLENLDVGSTSTISDTVVGFNFSKSGGVKRALSQLHLPSPLNLSVDPTFHFDIYTNYSGGVPPAGNVVIELDVKYIDSGEAASKASDETLSQTIAINPTQFTRQTLVFTLNRTLIEPDDSLAIVISRQNGDAADTFTSTVMIGKFATLIFG